MIANNYKTPQLQYDNQHYVKSFNVDTATDKQLNQFYHKYGIIVFRDVIKQEEIDKTIDDLWNNTAEYYKLMNKSIKRDDPSTWGQLRGFQKAYGFVGDDILEQPQIWENRRNPIVYKCFKRAYEAYLGKPLTQHLICCFDRGSLMLPSKINKKWRSQDIYHFDIDPWAWTGQTNNKHPKYNYDPDMKAMLLGENNYDPFVGYTKFAGVLALSDTNETSGGFECALGFQNFIHQWCKSRQEYTLIQQDKNLVQNFRKIFVRKGSLLIFSRQLPHNIYQNDSENFRYAQYLRMAPFSSLCLNQQLIQARKKLVQMLLPKNMDFSDKISRQIFMLDNYAAQQKSIKVEQKIVEKVQNQYQNPYATNAKKNANQDEKKNTNTNTDTKTNTNTNKQSCNII